MKSVHDFDAAAILVSVAIGSVFGLLGGITDRFGLILLGVILGIFALVQIHKSGVRQVSAEDLDIKLRAFDRNIEKFRPLVNEAGAEWLNVISAEKAQVIQKMEASAFGGKEELKEFLQLYDALENMPDRYFKREMDEKEAGLAARADEKLKELKELKERYGMAEDAYLSRSNAVMEEWARGLASHNKMKGNDLSRDIQWKDGEEFGSMEIVGLVNDKERVARRHRFEIKEFYASAKLNNFPALNYDEFSSEATYGVAGISIIGLGLIVILLWATDKVGFTGLIIPVYAIAGLTYSLIRDRRFRARVAEDREQRTAVRSQRGGVNPLGADYLDAIDEEMESLQSRLSAKEISVNEFCSKYGQMQACAVDLPDECFSGALWYTQEGLQRRMAAEEAEKAEKAKSGKAIDEKMAEAIRSEILSGPISGRLPSADEEREFAQKLTERLVKQVKWNRDHPAARG